MNIAIAAAVCIAAAAAEGLLAGGDVTAALKQIKQPRWALPLFGWVALGVGYYAACCFVLWRLLNLGLARADVMVAFDTLLAAMVVNASFNWFFFRRRDFRTSLLMYLPYAFLIAGLIVALSGIDTTTAFIFLAYSAYLPYALLWSFKVWRLNAS